MAKRALNYMVLPSRAITSGAATPNPGIVGVSIWSTTENAELIWNGSIWQLAGAGLDTNVPNAIGDSAAAGSSNLTSKTDHAHAHGVLHAVSNHHAVASGTAAGFMSSADFTKLAGIAANATVLSMTVSVTPADVGTAAAGTDTEAAHADHVHRHGPQALGDGSSHALATGSTAGFMSAADFTKLGLVEPNATAPQTLGGGPAALALTSATGSLSTASRQDHTHTHNVFTDPTLHAPADNANAGFMTSSDFNKLAGIATSATSVPVETAAIPQPLAATTGVAGSGTNAIADNHVHPHGVQSTATHHAAATASVAGFMTAAQYTKLAGISPNAPAETPPTLASTAPAAITDTGNAGVLSTAAREDHVHAHGDALTDPNDHAVATASLPGFVPSALQDKLDKYVYAVSGAGTANAGKMILLDASGKIATEYTGSSARGNIDDPTQDKILFPTATTQPAVNTDTAGGKLYVRGNSTANKIFFAPANSRPSKPIQPMFGSSKIQFYGVSAPSGAAYALNTAGVHAGSQTTTGFATIRNRVGHTFKAINSPTGASTERNIIYQLNTATVTRAKGFYVIITYNEGGGSAPVWSSAAANPSTVGLNNAKEFLVNSSNAYQYSNTSNTLTYGWNAKSDYSLARRWRVSGNTVGSYTYTNTSMAAPSNTDIMELHIFASPADTSKVYWQLKNITTNASEEGILTGTLPDVNTPLYPGIMSSCEIGAGTENNMLVMLFSIYVEQPY